MDIPSGSPRGVKYRDLILKCRVTYPPSSERAPVRNLPKRLLLSGLSRDEPTFDQNESFLIKASMLAGRSHPKTDEQVLWNIVQRDRWHAYLVDSIFGAGFEIVNQPVRNLGFRCWIASRSSRYLSLNVPLHIEAAVDVEDLAGDVGRLGRAEKEDGVDDVVDLAEPSQRDLGNEFLGDVVRHVLDDVGRDKPRGDTVDRRAVPGEFAGGDFCEPDQPRLARRVVGLAKEAGEGRDRCDVYDASIRTKQRGGMLERVESAAEVHPHHIVEIGRGHVLERAIPQDAGVVDEDVDPTEPLDDGVHRGSDGGMVGHIAFHGHGGSDLGRE